MDEESRNGESVDDKPSGLVLWLALVVAVTLSLVCFGVAGHLTGA